MTVIRTVELGALLELRERALTPGHPGRPVIWPYDNELATHYGLFTDDQLIGCVSITPQEHPTLPAVKPYHLHSMAVETDWQGQGLGRDLLAAIIAAVKSRGGDLVWATARLSAVGFYKRCGFKAGEQMTVEPTKAAMRYVWLALDGNQLRA